MKIGKANPGINIIRNDVILSIAAFFREKEIAEHEPQKMIGEH